MKQFVKALDKEGKCFNYLRAASPSPREEKVKQGIFEGPLIRKMMKDIHFAPMMVATEGRD